MSDHFEKAIARFWSRVEKRGADECWLFQGASNGSGYGAIWMESRGEGSVNMARRIEVGNMIVRRGDEVWRITADRWPNGWSWNAYHGCGHLSGCRDDYPTAKAAMLAGAAWLNGGG
jgi:hypothetical protein